MPKVELELYEHEMEPVPIAGSGIMAMTGVGDGRPVAVLILDSRRRPDIGALAHAHEHLGPGDAKTIWSPRSWPKQRQLRFVIAFEKPQHCVIVIEFDVVEQGGLVDQIVQNELVYIQPGKPGDRLLSNPAKVLIEVPSEHFRGRWDVLMREQLAKSLRKRGVSRREIRPGVNAVISDWRALWAQRMRNESGDA